MQEKKKILFLAEGQMGDSICLTPALRAVKNSLPDSHTTILLFHRRKYTVNTSVAENTSIEKSNYEGTAEIFKDNRDVDEVLEFDRKAMRELKGFKRLSAEIKCIRFLRKQKYDAVICTFPQNRFVIWSFLAGIKIRIGEKGQKFETLLTDRPEISRGDNGVLNYFCDLLKPLGITSNDKKTYFKVPPESIEFAKRKLEPLNISTEKKLLIIHPGASDKDRQWPQKKFTELINYIKANNSIEILIAYSEYDEEYINELNELSRNSLKSVETEKISDLAGLLKLADISIVHNSGPRHLAAAVGTKTIGLLEKYDDIMWKIYDDINKHAIIQSVKNCEACKEGKCLGIIPASEKFGARCMHDIEAKEVYSLVERIINNP
ncbi:MAG: glycosyltransferase family 9 protein [Ignavibacteria bacterium]